MIQWSSSHMPVLLIVAEGGMYPHKVSRYLGYEEYTVLDYMRSTQITISYTLNM